MLSPYSNRIRDGRFEWDGHCVQLDAPEFDMPHARHGHGWLKAWDVTEQGPATLKMGYQHQGSLWPWPYQVEAAFNLLPDRLELSLSLTNSGSKELPAGLGFHPFFIKHADSQLKFDAKGIWETSEPGLPKRHSDIPPEWNFSGAKGLADNRIDHCYSDWSGTARIQAGPQAPVLDISASEDMHHAVLYNPVGESFFCFEPVSHANDPFNSPAKGPHSGLCIVGPGDRITSMMKILITPPQRTLNEE